MKTELGRRSYIAAILFFAALGGGCGGGVAGVYEVCSSACAGGTACVSANVSVGGFVGSFCTNSCDPANPFCPDDGTGISPICVGDANDPSTGECYAGCPGGGGCPYSETCATDGNFNFCVP